MVFPIRTNGDDRPHLYGLEKENKNPASQSDWRGCPAQSFHKEKDAGSKLILFGHAQSTHWQTANLQIISPVRSVVSVVSIAVSASG